MTDPQMPMEMQRVALDRDGIPHNVGWLTAASDDELQRHGSTAVDDLQRAWRTRPGPAPADRELWWLDRIDDESKRRDGWTSEQLARFDRRMTARRERERAPGRAGRAYRALYRVREYRALYRAPRGSRARGRGDDDRTR